MLLVMQSKLLLLLSCKLEFSPEHQQVGLVEKH